MSLTLSFIENCSTGQLYKVAQDLGVVCKNMFELRQKIIIEVMRLNGSVVDLSWYTETVKIEKEENLIEDEKRRNKLVTYLDQIKSVYDTIKSFKKIKEPDGENSNIVERDDPLICFINNEMPNVEDNFEKMSEIVDKKPNCSLLICGVSGAGKSSFINLLIGENILPTSIRSNSSCQVRLTYGEPERAEIIDLGFEKHVINKSQFSERLSAYLENIKDRNIMSCTSATVYLQSSILEGGLDIYDTIGLGETEMYNNELQKDLNQITGIIFILKKNTPIGDKTIGGLSDSINKMIGNGVPGGSMSFIINMCDLLQGSNEKENLKMNMIEQLQEKCKLNTPEVTTFSAKQELDFQANNVMTTSYKDIIRLIQQLHINSINTNTVKVFSFLFKFVLQTIDQIKELEKYSASAKSERREYILRLQTLEHEKQLRNQSYKNQNEKFLIVEKNICQKKIEEHLRKDETKLAVVNIVLMNQQNFYGMVNIKDIIEGIEKLTAENILEKVRTFVENEDILKECCERMLTMFIRQFSEHQKNKDVISKEMNRNIDSATRFLKGDLEKINFQDLTWLHEENRSFLQVISPILVPLIKLKDLILLGFDTWYTLIASVFNNSDIQKFYANTNSYVKNTSLNNYSKYVGNKNNMKNLVECLFKVLEKVGKDFEDYLINDMKFLQMNIQSLEENMKNKEVVLVTYQEIKEMLENIFQNLCQFSLLRLQTDKHQIMRDKIEFLPLISETNDQIKPILKSQDRLVFRGKIKSKDIIDSCIMIYRNKSNKTWKDLHEEYTKHREISELCCRNGRFDIINCFLDIQHQVIFPIEDQTDLKPTFLVSAIDLSLKEFVNKKKKDIKEESKNFDQTLFEEIRILLKQILKGLTYLHKNGLVHYDLTGDSIGYSLAFKTVKLSSISLPTKVVIKYEKISSEYVLKISHLPSSILDRSSANLYTDSCDIYCLGIFLYWMWLGIHPFFNVIITEKITQVEEFVNMLKENDFISVTLKEAFDRGFAHIIYNWSYQCWKGKFTAENFKDALGRITFYGSI